MVMQSKHRMPCGAFDNVGWLTATASGLQTTECWYPSGGDLTGALHSLRVPFVANFISGSRRIRNGFTFWYWLLVKE